jgi:hypothetical protein
MTIKQLIAPQGNWLVDGKDRVIYFAIVDDGNSDKILPVVFADGELCI